MSDADWEVRLGWTFDLISDDAGMRKGAHERLMDAGRTRSAALGAFNHTWMVAEQGNWTPAVKAASDDYVAARRHVLPDALWEFVSRSDLPRWGGLPYALLYLEWEARFPDEWMAYGKGWGTKQGLLRQLSHRSTELPDWAQHKLIDLLALAVQREHRIWDNEYARLARAMPHQLVRERLLPYADTVDLTTRWRAGYLLWLLDRPGLPHPKPSQWRAWLAQTITMPSCAECAQSGIPILYGLPTPDARHAAHHDKLHLAGCFHPDDAPVWICPNEHRWRTDERLWQAAIDVILTEIEQLPCRENPCAALGQPSYPAVAQAGSSSLAADPA